MIICWVLFSVGVATALGSLAVIEYYDMEANESMWALDGGIVVAGFFLI